MYFDKENSANYIYNKKTKNKLENKKPEIFEKQDVETSNYFQIVLIPSQMDGRTFFPFPIFENKSNFKEVFDF